MKVTKDYLRNLIRESLEETGGYIDRDGAVVDYPSTEMPVKNEGNVYIVVDFSIDTILFASLDEATAKNVAEGEREEASMNGIPAKIRIVKLNLGSPVQKTLKELPNERP